MNRIKSKKHIKISASSCADMLDAFQNRIDELNENGIVSSCQSENKENVEGSEYIQGSDITDEYIDDLMSYVADELAEVGSCSWDIEGDSISFTVCEFATDRITDYTCPKSDLTGDIDTDINYIVDSTDNF